MERMTAADAWFLYLEGPTVHLHVTGLLVLDPSTAPQGFSFEAVREHLAERLDQLPMLRRRLVEVPFGIDHAGWVDDPDFDLDAHLRHRFLDLDLGTTLADLVGEHASVPLDRDRPLWEMELVEVSDGSYGLIVKMHHCIVDGDTGVDLLARLLDLTPEPASHERTTWDPSRPPGAAAALASATWRRLTTPMRPTRAALGIASSMRRAAFTAIERRRRGAAGGAHPLNAPRTTINGTITGRRIVAYRDRPLDEFRAIARAFGVTINDVVLAAFTAGLRAYLSARDDLPDRALVCSVPVSTHGHDGKDGAANQVSDMFVGLPVHLDDPVDRLRSIHDDALAAKEMHDRIGANIVADVAELIPPALFATSARLYSVVRLADRLPPVHNVVVSNVVGPPIPLYLAGAEVVGVYPFGPLMEGTGLNLSVVSSNGRLHLGAIACPERVEDPDELLDSMIDGLADLARRSEGSSDWTGASPGTGSP